MLGIDQSAPWGMVQATCQLDKGQYSEREGRFSPSPGIVPYTHLSCTIYRVVKKMLLPVVNPPRVDMCGDARQDPAGTW